MKVARFFRNSAAVLGLLGSAGLLASQTDTSLGSSAAPWLKIPTSVRSEGMADASVAQQGVDNVGVNAASLSGIDAQEVALGHNAWVQGTALENLSYGIRIGSGTVVGANFSYFNYGSIDAYTVNTATNQLVANGSFSPYGSSYGLALAQTIMSGLDAGVALRVVSESLDGSSSSQGYTGDLGLRWAMGSWRVGVAATNMVGTLEGSNLPGAFQGGLGWTKDLGMNSLNLEVDFQSPFADSSASGVNLGGEFWFNHFAAIRAGYTAGDEQATGSASGLALGLGLKLGMAELNYAYHSMGDLGQSNQLQLLVRFGSKSGEMASASPAPASDSGMKPQMEKAPAETPASTAPSAGSDADKPAMPAKAAKPDDN
jgi:hypothetical protein